jgi:magnesium-transporting ATPase (P-type)
MALLYVLSVSTYNSFDVTRDFLRYISKFYLKNLKTHSMRIAFVVLSLIFWPVWLLLFTTTYLLDMMVGEILDVSYGGMINILVNFFVVFTGFSVGIRSGNAVNAIQTFAGFSFIAEMDELVIDKFGINMRRVSKHEHTKKDDQKILMIRIVIYVSLPLMLGFFMYVTAKNPCFAFCNIE